MVSEDQLVDIGILLTKVPWKRGDLVLEIGTYRGDTAVFMAKILRGIGQKGVPIVSIDPFERCPVVEDPANPVGSYHAYQKTIEKAGFEDQCFCLSAFSALAAPAIADRIGFLLIDGHHSYEACLADLTLYASKVVTGGFIFVDDDVAKDYPGVVRAIDDYFGTRPNLTVHRGVGHAVVRIEEKTCR